MRHSSLVILTAVLAGTHATALAQYSVDVMASAPTVPVNVIDTLTSINEAGTMAFCDANGNNSRGMIAAVPGMPVAVTFVSVNRAFRGAAINDASPTSIAVRDVVPGSPPSYLIRRWTDAGLFPWNFMLAGSSLASGGFPASFNSATQFCDLNDLGQIAFVGLINGSVDTRLFRGTERPPEIVRTYTGAVPFLRPQISSSGDIVITEGNEVVVYDGTSRIVVAGSGQGFSSVGIEPGFTKNGRVVAFSGNRGRGDGVFIAHRATDNGAFSSPLRVAGENIPAPTSGPGELGCSGQGSPLFFSAIDTFQRVGVVHREGVAGFQDDEISVAYSATPNAASDPSKTQNNRFTANPGIWCSRVLFDGQAVPGFFFERTRAVLQQGDLVNGDAVATLRAYDPVAERAPDASEPDNTHWIGLWASGSGSATLALRCRGGTATDVASFQKYKQFDPPHDQLMLNPNATTPKRVSKIGCVLTALTMGVNLLAESGATPSSVRLIVLDPARLLFDSTTSNTINVPSFNYEVSGNREVFVLDRAPGWTRLVNALQTCSPVPVIIAVPSKGQSLASTQSGEKHYVLAYGLNPNRDLTAPVRASDIFVADPGYGAGFYDHPAESGYVHFRDAQERLVHVPLLRYFQAVNRMSVAGITYSPENTQARIEEWFDSGAFYVGSARYTIPISHLPHLVTRMSIRNASLRGAPAFAASLSVEGPVDLVVRHGPGGVPYVSDPSLLGIPDAVLMSKQGVDTPASTDDNDPTGLIGQPFPPYILVLPGELVAQDLEVEVRGREVGSYEVRLHTGSSGLAASGPLAGNADNGSQDFGMFAVAPPACDGDANGDGSVAFSDITSVLENWNANYAPLTGPGDANHDGLVNFADITKVLENWNIACP